jgi:serine/threonine protein kinase
MYMAPEVLCNEPYNTSADIFSFAATIYELFSRTMLAFSQLPNHVIDIEARARHPGGGALSASSTDDAL